WINVPLKKCLISVCSSCPDQLMHSSHDTAIYSANFEDLLPSHDPKDSKTLIWEGHGLLSNLLSNNNNTQVTGKLKKTDAAPYTHTIQVLIQLHPVRKQNKKQIHVRYFTLGQSFVPLVKRPRLEDSPTSVSSSSSLPWTRPLSDVTNETDRIQPSTKRKQHSPARDEIMTIASSSSHGKPYPSGNIKTLVDAYYHQSRRKKRDTKPPNTNDVRSYVEIDKNTLGMYILPAEVDSWTVLDLGKVVWDRASFHNQRYIYPVGYRVKKWYRSMVDSHSDTQYTCQILDGGDEPIFQLDADDNPGEVWRGPTPTTVWTIAVRRAFAIRNMDYGHNPVGPDFFGLRKNTIAKMIQDLPNADKCQNYIWQNFEATSGSRGKAMRRTSARVGSASSISSAGLSEPVSYVTSPPSRFSHNSPSTPSKAEPLSPNSETSSSEKSS
ncbi:F/Y-rich N-terminus-domain-containing protein, partial [Phycomyces blakesleeanus]